jgi:hypothetical protein
MAWLSLGASTEPDTGVLHVEGLWTFLRKFSFPMTERYSHFSLNGFLQGHVDDLGGQCW